MNDQTKWEQLDAEGKAPCVHCLEPTVFGSGRFVNRLSTDTGERDGYACSDCTALECDACGETLPLDDDYQSPATGEGYYHHECLVQLGWTAQQIEGGQN
jgi:hypothetical protein